MFGTNVEIMSLKLDHNSTIPLHVQAENLLRSLISQEEYQNGKLLPNEVELAQQLNISRNTLRQAINRLVFEQRLIRKKGYGTVVAPKGVYSNARNWTSFTREMKALGIEIKNFELHVSWQSASDNVANFFNVPVGTKVLCMEKLRGKTDFPFVYFISYFNPRIGITGQEDFSQPLYDMLSREFDIEVGISREEINARHCPGKYADKLNIEEGEPILVRKRYVYDIQDMPVEFNIGYYRADSFTYSIEFRKDQNN